MDDTVVFSLKDSGSDRQRITYAAYPDEAPVVSAGVPIPNWEKLEDPPGNLPEAARGNVWVADVSFVRELKGRQAPAATVADQEDRGWQFFMLYAGDQRLPRARGSGFSPTRSTAAPDRDAAAGGIVASSEGPRAHLATSFARSPKTAATTWSALCA